MSLEKWIPEGLALARGTAGFAKCTRRRVGAALIAPDGSVISTGRNGAPPGFRECTDGGCPRGRREVIVELNYGRRDIIDVRGAVEPYSDYNTPGPGFCISAHAEDNAITRAGQRASGALLAITHRPCASCIKRAAGADVALLAWWAEGGLIDIETATPSGLLQALVDASA